MKTRIVLSASAIAMAAGIASAGSVRLDSTSNSSGGIGAFQATALTGYSGETSSGKFLTFCLEKSEFIEMGKTYSSTIATSTDGAVQDPISPFTAFLYSNFRKGTLSGFNAAKGSDYSTLQKAIWALEGEMSTPAAGTNKFYDLAICSGWQDIGDVRVMRLYGKDGKSVQDQLTVVPLPPAAWAGLATMGGLIAVRRIRRGR